MKNILSKKMVIFFILVLLIFIIVFSFFCFSNIEKVNFKDVRDIYITYRYSNFPTTMIKLSEDENKYILKLLNNRQFQKHYDTPMGNPNYEIIFEDNLKLSFQYEDFPNWFNNQSDFPCNIYYNDKSFSTRVPVGILQFVVDKIENELSNQSFHFKTDKITIQTVKSTITLTDFPSIDKIYKIVRHSYEIDDTKAKEVQYTLNFNNGTILQIYGPLNIEFNDEGYLILPKELYGKLTINKQYSKDVQIPCLLFDELYSIIDRFNNEKGIT